MTAEIVPDEAGSKCSLHVSLLITVLEAESLTSDATALIACQVSGAAVVTGSCSLRTAGVELLIAAFEGIGIGRRRATRLLSGGEHTE